MHTSLVSPRRAVRPARLVALVGAALLTLSGCLQADLGVTLNDDESGVFTVRTVINRDQFAQIEEMFGGMMGETEGAVTDAPDPCAEMLADDMSTDELPPGATVEPIEDGDWCGAMASIPFANLEEFAEIAADFEDSSEDSDSTSLGAPSITKTDGGYRFTVSGLAMTDDSMGLGEGEEGMEEFGAMIEQFVQDMRISYDVRLPGNPVDHNADAVDGNRFQWTLEWGDTRTELFAETGAGEPDGSGDTGDITDTPAAPGDDGAATGDDAAPGAVGAVDDDGGSSLTWLWILLGVVAVAAIAGFVIYKNKSGSKNEPGAPLPPPGQPSPGWQPPTE